MKIPKGIRPTQNKVRKALFDILGDINDMSFLDLYAGSGAVGIEALSQGARRIVFVESNRRCVKIIKENLSGAGLTNIGKRESISCRIIGLDVAEAMKRLHKSEEKFDVIFLDPPYYKDSPPHQLYSKRKDDNWCGGLAKKTLIWLIRYDIVAPNGLIICQHFKKDFLPKVIGRLTLVKQAKYGDTVLSFYKKTIN